jgi:aminomethyltransferase
LRVTVSRTGYTGDLGYELWVAPEDAIGLWDVLMQRGRSRGIRPIGSRALNLARIEAGFLAPNIDFVSAERTLRVGSSRSPFELGLGWLVDFGKGHFTGRRALLEEQRRGPRRQLVGLDIEGNKPAVNALLYADRSGRKEIGSVSSAMWSPTCKRNLGLGMVDTGWIAVGSVVWAEVYLNRELVWERRMCRARVVERPFFDPGRRRATPPADV